MCQCVCGFMVIATPGLNDEMTFSSTVMVWLSWRGRTCGTVCFHVNIDSVNTLLFFFTACLNTGEDTTERVQQHQFEGEMLLIFSHYCETCGDLTDDRDESG